MARPVGEIRQALAVAAVQLVAERGYLVEGVAVDGVTWRDIAAEARVGWDIGRRTVANMVCAGELVRIGETKPAGGSWMALYAPAALVPEQLHQPCQACADALAHAARPAARTEALAD